MSNGSYSVHPSREPGFGVATSSAPSGGEAADMVRALGRVVAAVSRSAADDGAEQALLDAITEAFEWAYGVWWRAEDGAVAFAGESGQASSAFADAVRRVRFHRGEGCVGRAWRREEVVQGRGLGDFDDDVRASAAKGAGLKAVVCFPLLDDGNVVGAMEFFGHSSLVSEERAQAMNAVARLVSSALAQASGGAGAAADGSFQAVVEGVASAVVRTDTSGCIAYANPAALEQLEMVEYSLGISVADLVGIPCAQIFPGVGCDFASPHDLPHGVVVDVPPEKLEVTARPLHDATGAYTGAVVSWEAVTEKLMLETEMSRTHNMMESTPVNILFANTEGILQYVNPASVETLTTMAEHLPCSPDAFTGKPIDIFYAGASGSADITDPANLPLHTRFQVGDDTIDTTISAIFDQNGAYLGPMMTWSVITERLAAERKLVEAGEREAEAAQKLRDKVGQLLETVHAAESGDLTRQVDVTGEDAIGRMGDAFKSFLDGLRQSIGNIAESAQTLGASAEELSATSNQMQANASETSEGAMVVSQAALEVNSNIQVVASGAEELNNSIRAIAESANEAALVASEGVEAAASTNVTVAKLGESSAEIGKVVKVITSVAQQTNLLALNATIEAARAGEAGKGFAVVANEVKELAKETAAASEDIAHKIEAIQKDTAGAVEAIGEIASIINRINDIQKTIASAVEAQSTTTRTIAANVNDAAKSSAEISEHINRVAQVAQDTTNGAADTLHAASDLSGLASQLQSLVDRFTYV